MTLDSYCDHWNIGAIDFVKLDVEGSESRVLAGAEKVLSRGAPVVLMEVNRKATERADQSLNGLSLLLRVMGFTIFRIGKSSDGLGSLRTSQI